MSRAVGCRTGGRRWMGCLVVGALLLAPCVARAGKLESLDTSLSLVPDNVASYGVMFHLGDRVKALLASHAWEKITKMPVVQMGMGFYQLQALSPDSPVAKFNAAWADPQKRKSIEFVRDLFADEVFWYADESAVDLLEVVQEVTNAGQYGKLFLALRGDADSKDPLAQAKLMAEALAENAEKLVAPPIVLGFKVRDPQAAQEQLKLLEETIRGALEDQQPDLAKKLAHEKVGANDFLTLTLSGDMIPWEQATDTVHSMIQDQAKADKLIAHLKKQKLVIAVGLAGKCLLAAIGPSTADLADFGGSKRLVDLPEFKMLEKFADKPLSSVSYVNKDLAARLRTSKEDLDHVRENAEQGLEALPLPEDQQKQMKKDLGALVKDVQGMLPEAGPMLSFAFRNGSGTDGYAYDWGQHPKLDGSQPLGILSHVGGDPILAAAVREKPSLQEYDLAVKWIKVLYGYADRFMHSSMPDSEKERFDKFMGVALPQFKRIDAATRTMLFPALADGQGAFVLDVKLQSKQYVQALPATPEALPMIEPAVVVGVSDAELLRKAVREYWSAAQVLLQAAHELDTEKIPLVKLPSPKRDKTEGGELYTFALPKEWGVDPQIAPTAGLSSSTGVLAISPKHAARLLQAAPAPAEGVLADPQRPLAGAVVFHWDKLIDAIAPWVDFGTTEAIKSKAGDEDSAKAQINVYLPQVHDVLDVLKVFHDVTAETYFEGSVKVTHSRITIEDVK